MTKRAHITIVADRSGSMQSIRADAEGGLAAFVEAQRQTPGKATLLFVDFDGDDPHHVVYDGPLPTFDRYRLEPRGNTPLFDAIGHAIRATARKVEAARKTPELIYVVIQTDGQENASREWRAESIRELIRTYERAPHNWTFVFLATGPSAWAAVDHFVGTRMHGHNTVRAGSTGKSYAAATAMVANTMSESRATGVPMDYAAIVDDDGTTVTP